MRTYPMQDSMTVTKTQRETPKDPKRPQKCEGVSRQCRTEQDRRQGFFSRSPSKDLCKRFEKDLMRKYLQKVSLQYPSRRPRYKVPWLPCLLTRSLKFFTRSLEKTCFQGLSSFFFQQIHSACLTSAKDLCRRSNCKASSEDPQGLLKIPVDQLSAQGVLTRSRESGSLYKVRSIDNLDLDSSSTWSNHAALHPLSCLFDMCRTLEHCKVKNPLANSNVPRPADVEHLYTPPMAVILRVAFADGRMWPQQHGCSTRKVRGESKFKGFFQIT